MQAERRGDCSLGLGSTSIGLLARTGQADRQATRMVARSVLRPRPPLSACLLAADAAISNAWFSVLSLTL